jgi:Na+-driven multidrug efflux pump
MLFAAGKVVINSMAGVYGPLTAGALGVSNNIGGLTTNWHSGMLDGASALISQNRGAKAYGRTRKIFWWLVLVDVLIGLIGLTVVSLCLNQIAAVFAQSKQQFDEGFRVMIVDIHRWEMLGYITLGIHSAVNALLLGYGMGKSALALNMARIFLFRIPVLWALQKWSGLGHEAVGVTMMVSNISTGVISILAAIPVLRHIRRKEREEAKEAL